MPPSDRLPVDSAALATIWSPSIPAKVTLPQARHRIDLLSQWSSTAISAGSRVLEIGCGQGDMTAVLAAAVGPTGHVVAIDPADPGYGSPLTLGQAQDMVRTSCGDVVEFLRADAVGFAAERLNSQNAVKEFDAAVLAKSGWYFESKGALLETLRAAGKVSKRICVAEYALSSVDPRGQTHVLASFAQGALYAAWQQMSGDGESFLGNSNIRVLLGPDEFKSVAQEAGLSIMSEEILKCSEDEHLQDGGWDSYMVVTGDGFLKRIKQVEDRTGSKQSWSVVVRSLREAAVQEALKLAPNGEGKTEAQRISHGLKSVRTMDVWVPSLMSTHHQ